MKNIHYIIYLFLFALLLSLSCSQQSAGPSSTGNPRLTIQQLTDRVLLALATHDYSRFAAFIESPESADVSSVRKRYEQGLSAARRFLGPHTGRIVLDRWDAQGIDVSFGDDFLWATSRIDVSVRLSPAHKPKIIHFNFRFHRRDNSSPWRLHIP